MLLPVVGSSLSAHTWFIGLSWSVKNIHYHTARNGVVYVPCFFFRILNFIYTNTNTLFFVKIVVKRSSKNRQPKRTKRNENLYTNTFDVRNNRLNKCNREWRQCWNKIYYFVMVTRQTLLRKRWKNKKRTGAGYLTLKMHDAQMHIVRFSSCTHTRIHTYYIRTCRFYRCIWKIWPRKYQFKKKKTNVNIADTYLLWFTRFIKFWFFEFLQFGTLIIVNFR